MPFHRTPGSPPAPFQGVDVRVDVVAAAAVERGVTFYRTLGKTVARAYFKQRQLAPAVVHRILAGGHARGARGVAPPSP